MLMLQCIIYVTWFKINLKLATSPGLYASDVIWCQCVVMSSAVSPTDSMWLLFRQKTLEGPSARQIGRCWKTYSHWKQPNWFRFLFFSKYVLAISSYFSHHMCFCTPFAIHCDNHPAGFTWEEEIIRLLARKLFIPLPRLSLTELISHHLLFLEPPMATESDWAPYWSRREEEAPITKDLLRRE